MDDHAKQLNARIMANWKAEQRRILISRAIRWGVGIPLIAVGFAIPFVGLFLMLLGVVMITPDIAGYVSNIAGNILWSHHTDRPKPLYDIAEALAAKGKYAEAEQEYEKIIQNFPSDVKPHIDMINIAVTRLNDRELAAQLYRRGMDLLPDSAPQETLTMMYEAISTRLKPK